MMRSTFELIEVSCFWCGKETECVKTEIDAKPVDLCWSCLRKKAKASKNGRTAQKTEKAE